MPKLDLHGEIVSMVEVLVNDFIKENILLKNKSVLIIHGKSTNILTKEDIFISSGDISSIGDIKPFKT